MQSFDATYCQHGDCYNHNCPKFLKPETLAAWPQYRGISVADYKTENCGYTKKGGA